MVIEKKELEDSVFVVSGADAERLMADLTKPVIDSPERQKRMQAQRERFKRIQATKKSI